MNNNSKVPLVELEAREAPEVKEESYKEENTDNFFMYDMAKNHGGWYSNGSCIGLPFS
jgi:hypothetical protein